MTTESIATPVSPGGSVPAVATATWAAADVERFYAEYYPRLARYCYRLVRDEEVARDLTQEAFVRLVSRWVKLGDPAAYLFRVATNLVRTRWQNQRREAAAYEASVGAAWDRPPPHADLHLAVSGLRRKYREVVLLYYFADLPIAEVAAAVRRPEGTVKRQLAEARALLARDLEDLR